MLAAGNATLRFSLTHEVSASGSAPPAGGEHSPAPTVCHEVVESREAGAAPEPNGDEEGCAGCGTTGAFSGVAALIICSKVGSGDWNGGIATGLVTGGSSVEAVAAAGRAGGAAGTASAGDDE